MNPKELRHILVRLAIAAHRLHDDPTNPKRLVTLGNLIESLEDYTNGPEYGTTEETGN